MKNGVTNQENILRKYLLENYLKYEQNILKQEAIRKGYSPELFDKILRDVSFKNYNLDKGQNGLGIVEKESDNLANEKSFNGKKKVFYVFLLIFLLLLFIFYVNFVYSKDCDNLTCFGEMIFYCNRANFVSSGALPLKSEIFGSSLEGCKVRVRALENNIGVLEGSEMICHLPMGVRLLPQSQIEFCEGRLREDIQDLIISELYKTIGQNVGELSYFFRD
jgi:hypothetical protein